MKKLLMFACLLFATNVYAEQVERTEDAKNEKVQEQQQQATDYPTSWVRTDERPRFNQDESQEPSYGDEEQPSFQPEPR